MNKFLKVLYGLSALALGIFLSVSLIKMATSHDSAHVEVVPADTLFPDYVEMMNSHFDNFENREDHFHQTEDRYMLPMEKQENCLSCHSLWPHKKNTRTRAFNNQHSRYMTCMVCHIDEQVGRPVSLAWYDFSINNSITRQGPYGIKRISGDGLSGSENFISKIMPLIVDGDLKSRIYANYDTPMYKDFREAVRMGKPTDANEIRRQAEALVGKEASSCSKCHSDSSDFPWTELGFTGARLDEMQHSAVVGMVEKYEKFYFPAVFE